MGAVTGGNGSTGGSTGSESGEARTGDERERPSRNAGADGTIGETRRSVLRSIAHGSVAGGVAGLYGAVRPGDNTVDVVYALTHPGDDPWELTERRRTVPEPWLTGVERAFEANARLADANIAGLLGSFVVPGDEADPTATLGVELQNETVIDEIRPLVDGVDLTVSTLDEIPPRDDEVDDDPVQVVDTDEDDIPGGVQCAAGDSIGSLTPALYDPGQGETLFGTSNHVFGGDGEDHRGASLDLVAADGNRREIGTVRRGHARSDLIVARPVDGIRPTSAIVDADPEVVTGQFTRIGLADLAARGEPVEKVGGTTGHTEGTIEGVDGVTAFYDPVPKIGQLKWGSQDDMSDGDSGSVAYATDPHGEDGGLLVAGMNNARTWWPGSDYVWGTAAHQLRSAHGYRF